MSLCIDCSSSKTTFFYSLYRIEFNHRHLKYFCELDGLILYGEDTFPTYFPSYNIPMSSFPKICLKDVTNRVKMDLMKEENNVEDSCSYFNLLPVSMIFYASHFINWKLC